jgi:hypothetical protein
MTSEDGRWDPATVLGLRSTDSVLVAGNPAMMPWLTTFFQENIGQVVAARRPSELEQLLHLGTRFDKFILSRETTFTADHLLRAGAFRAALVTFPTDSGWAVEQAMDVYYPTGRWWRFDSTFGPVVVAHPWGASWRVLYA